MCSRGNGSMTPPDGHTTSLVTAEWARIALQRGDLIHRKCPLDPTSTRAPMERSQFIGWACSTFSRPKILDENRSGQPRSKRSGTQPVNTTWTLIGLTRLSTQLTGTDGCAL